MARPFDVIIGSQSRHCLSTEWSRSGPSPDPSRAVGASPGTQTCGTWAVSSGGKGHL